MTSWSISFGFSDDELKQLKVFPGCFPLPAPPPPPSLVEEAESESPPTKQLKDGEPFDVVSCLRSIGETTSLVRKDGTLVDVDHLRGKYVFICCISVPVLNGSVEEYCRALIDVYSELSRDDFEIVLVAKMRTHFNRRKATFDDFLSDFNCLAIPFSNSVGRRRICSSIGFTDVIIGMPTNSTILAHPEGYVLQLKAPLHCLETYGSEWFPFTRTRVHELSEQDLILRCRLDPFYERRRLKCGDILGDHFLRDPLSLHSDILQCHPSLKLHRIDPAAAESMTVSDLCNRHLGLYLCVNGQFIENLYLTHVHCLAMKQELEIILVCLPLFDHPKSYQADLNKALKRFDIKLWFIFPFNATNRLVCRRLWRVFGQSVREDTFVILPPCKKEPGEIEGRAVIDELGSREYPFTRYTILGRRFEYLKSLAPVSWFKDCLVTSSGSKVRMADLDGKKLLLYLDWLEFKSDGGHLCQLLLKHYPEIKDSGCEVVFIPLDNPNMYAPEPPVSEEDDDDEEDDWPNFSIPQLPLPWPIMPMDAAVQASVTAQLILRGDRYENHIIALGEDGKILSRKFHDKLEKHGFSKSLIADNLFEEVVHELTCIDTDRLCLY